MPSPDFFATLYNTETYIEVNGLINFQLDPDSRVVLDWMADPSSYPHEFRGKPLFLFNSLRRLSDGTIEVAYLFWGGDSVSLHWLHKNL